MHVLLFERNLNFFHEFVPAAQISLARSALFFRRLLPCIVDYLSFLRLRTLAWPLTGGLCINRDDRSGSVQYGQHL